MRTWTTHCSNCNRPIDGGIGGNQTLGSPLHKCTACGHVNYYAERQEWESKDILDKVAYVGQISIGSLTYTGVITLVIYSILSEKFHASMAGIILGLGAGITVAYYMQIKEGITQVEESKKRMSDPEYRNEIQRFERSGRLL